MRFVRVLILSVLISLSCSYVVMSSMVLSAGSVMSGHDLLEEVGIAVLLGLAIGCASCIFYADRIAFGLQLFIHFIVISGLVYIAGYIGNWYDVHELSTVLFVFVVIVVIYVMSWCIIRTFIKNDVQRLNKAIQKKREEL